MDPVIAAGIRIPFTSLDFAALADLALVDASTVVLQNGSGLSREERVTAAQGPEDWLDSKGAARHLYRRDGATNAFRLLRHRHPELNKISSGEGNQRRWRRRDLDAWVRDHRPALSKGAADGR